MKKNILIIIAMIIITLVGTSCTKVDDAKETSNNLPGDNEEQNEIKDKEKGKEENTEEEDVPKEDIDLSLEPNELGTVMVLMYHGIYTDKSKIDKDGYHRLADDFRNDLENLYNKNYRPVSLNEYVSGNINLPLGKKPVVLTFDDGLITQFNIKEVDSDGNPVIDENCAIGILEEFEKKHSDWKSIATFFTNSDATPFGQKDQVEYKLKWLDENGYIIGNHTYNHVNFTNADINKIQKSLGKLVQDVQKYLPDYKVNTLALPFGSYPIKNKKKDPERYEYLKKGEYEGTTYENVAIMAVGYRPHYSPYSNNFNQYYIHRVRAYDGEWGIGYSIDYQEKYEKPYVSDGNKKILTFPSNYEKYLDLDKVNDKELYIYEK